MTSVILILIYWSASQPEAQQLQESEKKKKERDRLKMIRVDESRGSAAGEAENVVTSRNTRVMTIFF